MAGFNVYLSYPTNDGYSPFLDITADVLESSFSSLKQTLESDEFNFGKIPFN